MSISWKEVGRGRPLVLVHGLADDHRAWRKALPHLVLDHRVILYDLRGHGESSLGGADGTLAQLSADLVALMDAISLPAATIAGFSLGGTIAMHAAVSHPGRVDGLALVSTSSRVNAAAASWYRDRAEMVDTNDPELRATLDKDTEEVYQCKPSETASGLLIRRQSTNDPRGFANACRAMVRLHEEPLDASLGAITVPTVVIVGDKDRHCPPRAAEIICSLISGSRLRILAGTGHAAPLERPSQVAADIRALGAGTFR
jgi:3-oxoadipate enol-lactonase